ncbi:hypothetical protein MWU52_09845 [Jannaschia sp. S6380]|uniref:hypothetical protein n=1 Tax=Jannaschia sp. S6380 TaxID=2926408 RepID=UPI001FF3252D|nr:hypothetical protein [Jannaschia sp. S6380]MCK0167849.1 hypothetical protein [Jannaschia sp. S6380]
MPTDPNLADAAVDNRWQALVNRMCKDPTVARGKMMTAEALTHAGKVFVFRSRRNGAGLGIKLGAGSDPAEFHATRWRPLQPFAGKAPMRGWFVIEIADEPVWDALADAALDRARRWADA